MNLIKHSACYPNNFKTFEALHILSTHMKRLMCIGDVCLCFRVYGYQKPHVPMYLNVLYNCTLVLNGDLRMVAASL